MRYLLVKEVAKKWNISERSVRNYCTQGRVDEARLNGKTWEIPEDAQKPGRINRKKEVPKTLLEILQEEKKNRYSGGIYHKTQIDLTYNSNHIEGSRLTHDQTRYIFETNTIGIENEVLMYFRNSKKSAQDMSLDDAIDSDSDGNKLTLMDIMSVEEDFVDNLDIKIKSEKLKIYINNYLTPREKLVITLRYGLDGNDPLTQREIAKKLNISRSYVSRIERKALDTLKTQFM